MQIKDLIKNLNNCSHLLFPKICLHCGEKILDNDFFCLACSGYFDFLSPPFAFSSWVFENNEVPLVATFGEIGPAKSLLLEMRRETIPHLYKLAASFMVCQYLKLDLEMPDFVVPIFREGNSLEILGREVAKILNRPFFKLFYKINMGFWQSFFIKKTSLQRKKILLITDIFTEEEKKSVSLLVKDGFFDVSILSYCK